MILFSFAQIFLISYVEEFLKIGNTQDLLMGTPKFLDAKPVSYFETIHLIALYAN
jgi:hypothetical protein